MKLGIKVSPRHDCLPDLIATNPEFAEIWFNVTDEHAYTYVFDALKQTKTPSGLHFWGVTKDGWYPTIAHPDATIRNESMALIKHTIDIASSHHCIYVNIHPGVQTNVRIDYAHQQFLVSGRPNNPKECQNLFLEHIQQLSSYAKANNVLLIVETVPPNVYNNWENTQSIQRSQSFPIHELPITTLHKAATHGIAIANDFGHTAACAATDTVTSIWEFLQTETIILAPATKLIHIGFIVPPYNGTDFHDTLDNPLFETLAAIPNHLQIKKLLQIFINRDDVYALVEPHHDHVKNYHMAQQLLQEIRQKTP